MRAATTPYVDEYAATIPSVVMNAATTPYVVVYAATTPSVVVIRLENVIVKLESVPKHLISPLRKLAAQITAVSPRFGTHSLMRLFVKLQ